MSDGHQHARGEETSVSSSVEVEVPPAVAFTVFTEERIEPGVGGRLLEVYDDGELELGRITTWDPGRHLAWISSLDDVATDVRFGATTTGTSVRVVARIPDGGQDRGGTAWTRVVPNWFFAWCGRRDDAPREVLDLARLALGIKYERPAAAARWLADVFGFESAGPLPEGDDPLPEGEHGHPWIEFRIGNSSFMIFNRDGDEDDAGKTHIPWGLPMYTAEDLESNRWTFAQARPTM